MKPTTPQAAGGTPPWPSKLLPAVPSTAALPKSEPRELTKKALAKIKDDNAERGMRIQRTLGLITKPAFLELLSLATTAGAWNTKSIRYDVNRKNCIITPRARRALHPKRSTISFRYLSIQHEIGGQENTYFVVADAAHDSIDDISKAYLAIYWDQDDRPKHASHEDMLETKDREQIPWSQVKEVDDGEKLYHWGLA
ncbi:hypothetical protein K504DRAFT_506681 [Pleomassaria siparia CBS 279.74]|uniref:Uncharacterized protein n=1 Tax=Pleomassaria siparia CBS 279.74 TaxID=1314801 RepID=A0A6G1JW36_9PLEO|nr:hypothetical protein K504DRAFT_506681 [Pleomassaria siparia CBS 279.74]